MKVFAIDVMHKDVKSVHPNLSVGDLFGRFANDDVGGFPVVEDTSVVGVVSTTDAFRVVDSKDTSTVRDIMSHDVVSVLPTTTLHDAAALMSEKKIHRVLVMLEDGTLAGVLSALDIVRACGNDRIDISFTPPQTLDF